MRVKSLSVDKKITNILKYTKHRSILWIVSTTNELKIKYGELHDVTSANDKD